MEKGNIYSGFELLEKRTLKDIKSEGFLFEHKKSGARLLYISNDDDNKVFSISFRTPPNDNTGVAHILEHSVLCGSRKYKAKEPFVELLKGSLNTYLNAMTFSDKTMYPIASRNDKDFMNLMDVYMDAVFYPLIYTKPEIFYQEGWHYGIENKDTPLSYKGVVYNEMKGDYSSGSTILISSIDKALFPDTQYKYESGGDPKNIPDLTYEQFLEFHKKYYHPSNSYIYLYGNGNIETHLSYLDKGYLSKFEKLELDSNIKWQQPFKNQVEIEEKYSIAANENENDKTYLSLSFVTGISTDAEKMLALNILNYILLQTPASPLKKALLDENIGKSVYGYFSSSIHQPVFNIIAENANPCDKLKFKKIVYTTLENLVAQGINKKLIEGAINVFEFSFREADYGHRPKGLTYNIQAMKSWLYDGDPMIFMEYSKYFENIKSAITNNYFEELINTYILKNNHSVLAQVAPEKNLDLKVEKEIEIYLSKYKNSLTQNELNKLIEIDNSLKKYQQTHDTKEILEQIPILELDDIKREIEKLEVTVDEIDDYKIITHTAATNKIVYLNLSFDTTVIPQDTIPYISLLASMLGKLSTKNYNYEDLSNELTIYTGDINFNAEVYTSRDRVYYPKFVISSKVLEDKLPKLLSLLDEIINNTLYNEDKRIKEILKEYKTNMLNSLLDYGNITAVKRAESSISQSCMYDEYISNISQYEFLCSLENDINDNITEIKQKLSCTANLIFNRKNLIISSITENNYKPILSDKVNLFVKSLKNEERRIYKYEFNQADKQEAFLTSSKIQYVAKAVDYKKNNAMFNGNLRVLQTILDLDYLWNEVRVQGGAYGVFISISKDGYILLSSYRDPNIKRTLNVYNNIGNYISNLDIDDRELRKYIIGTINSLDTPLSFSAKCKMISVRYITGLTDEQLQNDRNEILDTNQQKIKYYAKLIDKALTQNNIVVVGNENNINNNSELFNSMNTVLQS